MIEPLSPLGQQPAHRAPRRGVGRIVAVALASIVAMLGFAPGSAIAAAPAENTVVSSSPEQSDSLDVSPELIVIVFAEDLGEVNSLSVVCDEPVTLPAPEVIDGTTLQVEVTTPLPSGTCTARYTVSSADEGGPETRGNLTFIVENDTVAGTDDAADSDAPADAATATTLPAPADATGALDADGAEADPVVVDLSIAGQGNGAVWLGRLLSILGIATLFGSLLVITAAWPEGVEYLITIKFLRGAWVLAMIGTLLYVAFASAAVTPDGGGSPFSPGTWTDLLDAGWSGRLALLRLPLIAASAWVAFRPDRAIDPTTQLAALGIPGLAAATLGVSRTIGDLAALGVLMGVIHALAMSVWVGGVILLARVVLAGPGDEDLIHAVRGFSRVSTPAIVITIVTGLIQMFRLDGGELFQSGHGRVVVLKTFVIAVMIFVAFSARQFVAQRLNRAQQLNVPLADRLRRAFGAEAGIGVATLVLSAWLLAFIPPNVSATPSIDYEISQQHSDAAGVLDVEVKLTDDAVGLIGLQVEVKQPTEGLNGITVVLTAPTNDQGIGSIRQPVPLETSGFAVRDAAVGLPVSVPGNWTIMIEAVTASGTIQSVAQIYEVSNADGSAPDTAPLTAPAVSIVEVVVTDPPTEG
ncbi:MAG: copper resistance CopC/CopD family protein [Ilumatobacter sp.]